MKTSCLRLKLVELNFLVSYNTDDQSKTDVANAINVFTTNDVSRGADMPSFITIALVIDKECNTPGTGSAVNMQ